MKRSHIEALKKGRQEWLNGKGIWAQLESSNYRLLFSKDSPERVKPFMSTGRHFCAFNEGAF